MSSDTDSMIKAYRREIATQTQRANRLEKKNQQLRDALEAVLRVAVVSTEGDPWFVENEGIDATAAYELAREALGE